MIDFSLAYLFPKLAWVIPCCVMVFIVYIAVRNIIDARKDSDTKRMGFEVDAQVLSVKYDAQQRINNHLSAVITVSYFVDNITFISSRGIVFLAVERNLFVKGAVVKIKVNNKKFRDFIFIGYRTI